MVVLQPFLRHTARGGHGAKLPQAISQENASSKLDEAVALVNTLGCEVVLKEVSRVEARKKPADKGKSAVWKSREPCV